MIRQDRILGGVVAACGGFLLLYLIPNYVTEMPGNLRDPSLFPKIAAGLMTFLGILQILKPGVDDELPTWRELLRLGLIVLLLIGASQALPVFGFIPTAMVLMAAVVAFIYERRALWIGIAIVVVPLLVWAAFVLGFKVPLS